VLFPVLFPPFLSLPCPKHLFSALLVLFLRLRRRDTRKGQKVVLPDPPPSPPPLALATVVHVRTAPPTQFSSFPIPLIEIRITYPSSSEEFPSACPHHNDPFPFYRGLVHGRTISFSFRLLTHPAAPPEFISAQFPIHLERVISTNVETVFPLVSPGCSLSLFFFQG